MTPVPLKLQPSGLQALVTAIVTVLAASATSARADPATDGSTSGSPADPRLREVRYDPQAVVTVPVRRGVLVHVLLDADEAITEVAAGLGGDCIRPESAWCVSAQPGGRSLFVKARSSAAAPNTLAVLTTRRAHAFEFVVLAPQDPQVALQRLTVRASAPTVTASPPSGLAEARRLPDLPPLPTLLPLPVPPGADEQVARRLQARPTVRNTDYSLAEGEHAGDIVPTLVFDDGRFTYLRFPGHRDIPAAFQVLGDGSEALVNTRMEDDLLVIDRVARQFVLRSGAAVVAIWNEAFDLDAGPGPADNARATSVPGVQRSLRGSVDSAGTRPAGANPGP